MEEKLKSRLKEEFRMTDEQIGKLEAEGVQNEADLSLLSADEIKDVTGCGLVTAKKINQAFAPAVAQVPTAVPPTIVVRTGKPEDMSLRELVQAIADGERSTDYVVVLRKHVGNKRVFVRKPGEEKLDVEASLELIDHVGTDLEGPEFWGEVPTETLEEILERRAMANPITGAKLAKGDPWMTVSEDRCILAAYARLAGHLTGKEDEFTLTEELKAKKLGGRWTRIQAAFSRAEKAHDPIIDQARAAIYYRKGGRPTGDAPFRRPTF